MERLASVPSADLISSKDKRAALELVLKSNAFSRADQLRSFLRFIGEMELEGKADEITEYLIAVKALGRANDFSALEDSCVRVMARSLRQKLEEFYFHEKPEAEIRIELAKGSYHPRFVRVEKGPAPAPPEIRPEKPAPPTRSFTSALIAFVIGIAIATVATFLFMRNTGVPAVDPIIREAWGPIARPDANVLIAVGNPLHMIFHPFPVALPPDLKSYPAPPETYEYYRRHRPLPTDAKLTLQAVDNSTSMGHMLGVVTAAKLLNSIGASYQVLPERTAPLASFRGRNVLLIGSPEDSMAVSSSLQNMPFTVDFDAALHELVVRDRRNNKVYAPKRDNTGYYSEVYGLITVSPTEGNLDGSRRTIVFSGITSVGCHAAVDFMTSPQDLHAFLNRVKSEGYKTFPATYQIVVRATTTPDTLLTTTEYEAHAVIEKAVAK